MNQQSSISDQEYENFRAYHSLQYDRMDKLESRREIFNNMVLTASLAVITFGYSKDTILSSVTATGLLIILVAANFAAIMFSQRTFEFFKMQQERAKAAREKYAPEFNIINDTVGKRNSSKDWFNRTRLYIILHFLTILLIIVAYGSSIKSISKADKSNKKSDSVAVHDSSNKSLKPILGNNGTISHQEANPPFKTK